MLRCTIPLALASLLVGDFLSLFFLPSPCKSFSRTFNTFSKFFFPFDFSSVSFTLKHKKKMTDRVHHSAKPNGTVAASNGVAAPLNPPPAFSAPKSQLYNPARYPYRPNPHQNAYHNRRRCSGRRCFCLCCFWSILIIAGLLLLAAVAGAAIYVLYRPRRPTFSISSLKISQFNLTTTSDDTTRLSTKLNVTLSSKNSNKKLVYFYDPITITALSDQVQVANGSFPNFNSFPNNITILHSTLVTSAQVLDVDSVTSLKSNLKRKNGLPMQILLDTMVVVKMDGLKSKKVGIRVTCDEIRGSVPKGKSPSVASTSGAKCKVDLRIKIWKWTF